MRQFGRIEEDQIVVPGQIKPNSNIEPLLQTTDAEGFLEENKSAALVAAEIAVTEFDTPWILYIRSLAVVLFALYPGFSKVILTSLGIDVVVCYFEEGGVVLLKRAVWYFEEGGVVL